MTYISGSLQVQSNLRTKDTLGMGREFDSCMLSGSKKRPPLGGYLCISTIVISFRDTAFVCCEEVVHFLEGPLWEVRLYNFASAKKTERASNLQYFTVYS